MEAETVELIKKPKEYVVRFSFPNPPPLNPPILGLKGWLLSVIASKSFTSTLNVFDFMLHRSYIWLPKTAEFVY